MVVLINDTFDNNFGVKNDFTKYLKESCWYCSEKYFSFKYFPKYAFCLEDFIKFGRQLLVTVSINGLRNVKLRVVSSVLNNISPSNIIPTLHFPVQFH